MPAQNIAEMKYQRNAGVFSPELVRLHHENKALRRQLTSMSKEKLRLLKGLEEREKGK